MGNINAYFARAMVTEVNALVKKTFPKINLRRHVGVISYGSDTYEVEVIHEGKRYVYVASALSKTEERAEGLYSFLKQHAPEALEG